MEENKKALYEAPEIREMTLPSFVCAAGDTRTDALDGDDEEE